MKKRKIASPNNKRKVKINNTVYESIVQASKELGIKYNTLYSKLRRYAEKNKATVHKVFG